MNLTCLALAVASWLVGAAGVDDVAVRVNGEAVSRSVFLRVRENPLTREALQRQLGVEPPPEHLDRAALRKVIHLRLLIQEARRRSITVGDEELDDAIAALRRRFEDLRGFGAWMAEQGLDEESLFEAVRDDLLAGRASASVAAGVRLSDDDVRQYHRAHADELRREEVRLQIIAVDSPWAAATAVSALRDGEAFSRVARRQSGGIRAARGGDTGWVNAGSLSSPLREAIASLERGEARGPLQRGSEYLIVRLADRRPGAALSLANARPEIERRLLPQKQREFVDAWLARRAAASRIELAGELAGKWSDR